MPSTLPFASLGKSQLEPEFADAFQQWKLTPSPKTNSALLMQVKPVLDTALMSYGGGSTGSPLLKSHAKQLALEAFKTYDPQRATLRTHLLTQLRRLQRLGAQEQAIISVPEQVALDRQHLQRQFQELEDQLGREPSDLELADATGLSLKRLNYVRQNRISSNTGRFGDVAADSNAGAIPNSDLGEEAWHNFVYHDLEPQDQVVMGHLLGMGGRQRLGVSEIAKRLGVSPAAVSQRAQRIQQMIDERNTLHLF